MGFINKGSSQNLRARVKRGGHWWENLDTTRDDRKIPDVVYSTGGGFHAFKFKGKSIWVHHTIGKTILTGWDKSPKEQEDLYIQCYGYNVEILKEFITTAIKHCVMRDTGRTGIYEKGWCDTWRKCQSKKCRSMDSVILDDGVAQGIIDDIRQFE